MIVSRKLRAVVRVSQHQIDDHPGAGECSQRPRPVNVNQSTSAKNAKLMNPMNPSDYYCRSVTGAVPQLPQLRLTDRALPVPHSRPCPAPNQSVRNLRSSCLRLLCEQFYTLLAGTLCGEDEDEAADDLVIGPRKPTRRFRYAHGRPRHTTRRRQPCAMTESEP